MSEPTTADLVVHAPEGLLNVETGDPPYAERFWVKVDKSAGADGCWPWLARISNGYGYFTIRHGKQGLAHRLSYEMLIGPIPHGLQIDHLCCNRACVNPAHLEPVTLRENLRRGLGTEAARIASAIARSTKTHCKYGHEFTSENTRHYAGRRHCRTCARLHARRYRAEARAA